MQCSLAHWAYFALLRSTIRNSRLATLPLASLLCSLDFRFACSAHCARRSSVPQGARFVRPPPLPSSIRNGRPAAPDGLQYSLAYWAYYGLFPPQAAAFVRPLQFPLKSCGFSSAETARKRFLLWKMGFSDAAHCTPMHPLNSAWSFHCARKPACGSPCFIGLTSACFAHCARPSCAPAVHAAGDD